MTVARLEAELNEDELLLWMADDELKSLECPNCGVEARDLMDYEYQKRHCPVCKSDYHVTKRTEPWPLSAAQAPSEDSQAATP